MLLACAEDSACEGIEPYEDAEGAGACNKLEESGGEEEIDDGCGPILEAAT